MSMFWPNLVDALQSPVELFRRLREHPAVLQGILVATVGQMLFALGPGAVTEIPGMEGAAVFHPAADVVLTVLGYLVYVIALHATARALGGDGRLAAGVSALGLASAPFLLYAPIHVAATLAGVPLLASIGFVGLSLWGLVLDILAVRETYGFSTGRAIGAMFLSFLVLAVMVVAAVIVAGIVTVALTF